MAPPPVARVAALLQDLRKHCTCSLCGELWDKPASFPCGHIFCYDCAIATLEGPGISQSQCPTCKEKAWKRDLKPNVQMAAIVEGMMPVLRIVEAAAPGAPAQGSGGDQACRGDGAAGGRSGCAEEAGDGSSNDGVQGRAAPPEPLAGLTRPQLPRCQGSPGADGDPDEDRLLEGSRRSAHAAVGSLHGHPTHGTTGGARTAPGEGGTDSIALDDGSAAATLVEHRAEEPGGSKDATHAAQLPICAPVHLQAHTGARAAAADASAGDGAACTRARSPAQERPLDAQPGAFSFPGHPDAGASGDGAPVSHSDAVPGAWPASAAPHTRPPATQPSAQGHGGAAARAARTATAAPQPLPASGAAATPSCRQPWLAATANAPAALATPHSNLLEPPRSQPLGGWATHSAVRAPGGGQRRPGSIVSIRRHATPTVNNAYLNFHAALEEAVHAGGVGAPAAHGAPAGAREPPGSNYGHPRAGVRFDAAAWLRRLAALPGPTSQEREALVFELSVVEDLLAELDEKIASFERTGGARDGDGEQLAAAAAAVAPGGAPAGHERALEGSRGAGGGVGAASLELRPAAAAGEVAAQPPALGARAWDGDGDGDGGGPGARSGLAAAAKPPPADAPGALARGATGVCGGRAGPGPAAVHDGHESDENGPPHSKRPRADGAQAGPAAPTARPALQPLSMPLQQQVPQQCTAAGVRQPQARDVQRAAGRSLDAACCAGRGSSSGGNSSSSGSSSDRSARAGGYAAAAMQGAASGGTVGGAERTDTASSSSESSSSSEESDEASSPPPRPSSRAVAASSRQRPAVHPPPERQRRRCRQQQQPAEADSDGEDEDECAGPARRRARRGASQSRAAPPERGLARSRGGLGTAGVQTRSRGACAAPHAAAADADSDGEQVPQLFVCTSNLDEAAQARVRAFCQMFSGRVEALKEPSASMTHMIVELDPATGRAKQRTIKYLHAVVQGCLVVSPGWADACVRARRLVAGDSFQVPGDPFADGGAAKSRRRLLRAGVPLFMGVRFCIDYYADTKRRARGQVTAESIKQRPEIESLVKAGDGIVLHRPQGRAGGARAPPRGSRGPSAAAELFGSIADAGPYADEADVCAPPPPRGGPKYVLVFGTDVSGLDAALKEWEGKGPLVVVTKMWLFDSISHFTLLDPAKYAVTA